MSGEVTQGRGSRVWVALVLFAAGAFVAWHATEYDLGSLRRMGPGYFPLLLGVSQCLLAIVILVAPDEQPVNAPDAPVVESPESSATEHLASGESWRSHLRAFVLVLGAITLFAVMIRPAGFAPATAMATLVAGFAEPGNSVLNIALLSVGVTIGASLVFVFALGVPIPLVAF